MSASPANPYRVAISGMIGMAAAMGIGRFVYTPILPGMMSELGLSPANAGLIASANFLGYLLGAVGAGGGWAEGRERSVVLTGLAVNALLAVSMAATDSLAAFLAIRFLAGIASAFVMIFLSTIIFARLAASQRSDLQVLHFGGVGVGIAVSATVTGALVLDQAAWWAGWLWAGAISGLAFVAVTLLLQAGPARVTKAVREPPLPKSRRLMLMILAYGIFGVGYIVTATFLVAIVRAGGAGRLFESLVWLVAGLAVLPSLFLWRLVVARKGYEWTFAIGCVVEAAGVVASVLLDAHIGPLVGALLLGGTFVAMTAYGMLAVRLLAPQSPRRALALMTVAFGIGQILGPIAAGYIAEWSGDFVLASLGAALALLLAGIVAWMSLNATN